MLIDCIKTSTNAIVLSHERDATKRLFGAVRYFVDNLKIKPTVSIDSKTEMSFPKTGSNFFISTAGQKAAGRGDTIGRAHLSEAAFYPDLKGVLAGVAEAAEYGQVDIETTPNGREEFYDMWQKAKEGNSAYTPIFIPWFFNEDYSSEKMTEKEKAGLSVALQELFSMSDEEFNKTITEEEAKLKERVAFEYDGEELTNGQLKWRRYKIWDKGALFFQEYPEDDVSCFLQSGRSVFTDIVIDITKRIPFDDLDPWIKKQKWTGKNEDEKQEAVQTWKKRTLYAAVDGAEGTPTGDRHAFSLIDAPADKGTAHVVFEYVSNEPIDVFWLKIQKVLEGLNVRLAIEKNGVGLAHVQEARKLGIPFIEWTTTGTNRPVMITDLEKAYRKKELIETYPEAQDEALAMIYSSRNRADHPAGKHDDRVFSRAIAWQMRTMPEAKVTFI